ncbi:hormogonium polysaccharide secretion pseudopilin HpsC, partial [Microcoleus sp. OTE_8_concoct_300]|uniref:hormogonium polysaccharide secretion pseudopilin HpsC n=1 Tax=Microcoleus sp. OTE_8_concoct_300 TaxID=2964710 RepID=UPI00403F67B7
SLLIKNVPYKLAKEEVKMKNLLRLLLKSQHQRNRSGPAQTDKGMTLVELLVGAIMAFLVITPMLAFVVDMLNTDRREQVKSNTEQDIQAAVDFIAQDLSQAIYIYDNNSADGVPKLLTGNFIPSAATTKGTPILVFWKRQQLNNSLPIVPGPGKIPKNCAQNTPLKGAGACNDTYVLSLVAYYQVSRDPGIWCQPSGSPCPTRIVRYQIQDGLRDPTKSTDPNPENRYFDNGELKNPDTQKRSDAFNIGTITQAGFDISKPTENVTKAGVKWDREDVLVNYIDHGTNPAFKGDECKTALGNPTTQTGTTTAPIQEQTLRVTDTASPPINSFYACVDTSKNIARVTIRGNSLRRLQPNDTDYKAEKSAYFPTASVQVQGLGARGK